MLEGELKGILKFSPPLMGGDKGEGEYVGIMTPHPFGFAQGGPNLPPQVGKERNAVENYKNYQLKARRSIMKKIPYIAVLLLVVFSLAGCAGMSETQQRTLSGGVIGAGAGAGIAAIAGGNAWVGAAVGGAGGALTGYIIGESHK
ncbi:MAG TPA: hypothetical protein VNN20_16080 [Thermodesulfobacteriota bacterium]|nr:hypothetical protein [Thermodesulfobacteriota bacterium]